MVKMNNSLNGKDLKDKNLKENDDLVEAIERDNENTESTIIVNDHKGEYETKLQRIQTVINGEQLNELRRRAYEAVKLNKIFLIRGCFQSVRNALKSRGWVEKIEQHQQQQRRQSTIGSNQMHVVTGEWSMSLPHRKAGESRRQFLMKCERSIMSRFIEHLPIDLMWIDRKEKSDYLEQNRNPQMLINKFNRTPFTNKEGLNSYLRDLFWFYDADLADVNFPRCFNVWTIEELNEFVEHFRLNACIAFLRWLIFQYECKGIDAIFSIENAPIPYSAIDFAMQRCQNFIDTAKHLDIDSNEAGLEGSWEHEWETFLQQHRQFLQGDQTIQIEAHQSKLNIVQNIEKLLDGVRDHWPQYTIDGHCNLWIIKPANKCRGRGIHLSNNLTNILNIVNPSMMAKSRFVIQKYIERPLIIHQTKFDIRQWFLISNIQPLMIWMYKECYLRFSSQEYTLKNYHESVHLTNHAIQKKYTNQKKRDRRLPSENMWDSYTFQAYLREIGKQQVWWERIYPGMRKAIIGTMLASQDFLERNPNTFELFGADFMICENFYPWLIEINSNPDLAPTTSVTARMCPQCLEDVVKVIIDRRSDAKADVGNFELIYRQVVTPTPAYVGLNLCLKGKQLLNRPSQPSNQQHHGVVHGKPKRRGRAQQSAHINRQRGLNLSLSPGPPLHKVMPTFNATDYIEQSLQKNVLSTSTLNRDNKCYERKKTRDDGCIRETLKFQPEKQQKRHKSTMHIERRTRDHKALQIVTEKTLNLEHIRATTFIRHRSCGPRLNIHDASACLNGKLRFLASNYRQRKSASLNATKWHYYKALKTHCHRHSIMRSRLPAPPTLPLVTISKSVDSIKDLELKKCNDDRRQTQQTKRNVKSLRKFPSTPAIYAKQPTTSNGQEDPGSHLPMRAIGKSITKWNKSQDQMDRLQYKYQNEMRRANGLQVSPRYLTTHSVPLTPNRGCTPSLTSQLSPIR